MFLLIIVYDFKLGFPNLQRCCNGIIYSHLQYFSSHVGVIPSFIKLFVTETYFTRSPEVNKCHTFLEPPPITGTWGHVNIHVMYSKLKSIDKICLTFKGRLVTTKGHFEIRGQVQIHIGM